MAGILSLPESRIADVIFFTSPRDACRLACVSTTFKSTADSDVVWDRFLPPEYASSPRPSLSKKELYLRACHNPVLINEGKLSFWLDKPTGKKCYMISARELTIIWVDNPLYWTWISLPEARFPIVAELNRVCWFEISGTINTSLMSPVTTYVVYLVFKRTQYFFGFDSSWDHRVEVTVGLTGSDGQKRTVYFHSDQGDIVYGDDHGRIPQTRGDGWLESELGEFFYGGDEEGELSISILGIHGGHWKGGLVVQGIEIRPKSE
ncbi:hypothetical protein EZV62_024549 [Acer yangbiense]|uniref:F-box domain-containing protein n=1 Tax=Acer yangbiense TaxID=1000413 RepID=A0A5C7GV51_9ROSI|nr:hypothetical protein EZV62_024549 [Acer yangbiense]